MDFDEYKHRFLMTMEDLRYINFIDREDIIRKFYADLLEKCIGKWKEANEIIYDYDNKKLYLLHKQVLYSIIYHLERTNINNFKEIHMAINICEDIIKHMLEIKKNRKSKIVYKNAHHIVLFMSKSFDSSGDNEDVYSNLENMKIVLNLNDKQLNNMLTDKIDIEEQKRKGIIC